ncbi:MAG: PIN domain-containing protein [Acidobacteria bacterium]|nr:PIN domain-containing protein [Acidobacteriota bacterium]
MRTAIDTNVLSSLLSHEPTAAELAEVLRELQAAGGLAVCAVVYAELCAHPQSSPVFIDQFLETTHIWVDFLLGEDVWRLAADAFSTYSEKRRKSAGTYPRRLLADFIVGAHALLRADRLLTLDKTLYRQAFPKLKLLS